MKRLIFLFALLLNVGHFAAAAPVLVQQKGATATSVTLDASPTSGNSLILIATGKANNTPSAVSGGGVTWTAAVTNTTNRTVSIWYGHSSTGASATVTVTYPSGIGNNPLIHVTEWSGLANAGPQSTNTNNGAAVSTFTTNSVTPTDAVGVSLAGICWQSSINPYSTGPTNSYTRLTQVSGSATLEEAYLITASTASTSTGVTISGGTDNYGAAIVYFAATVTGPTQFQKQSGFFNLP